jgi:hypothetical protein
MSPMNDPNELVQAAFSGKVGLVHQFLREGADVNAVGKVWTPLHAAIEAQRFFCVAILLRHGADISQVARGLTPLAHAVDAAIDQAAQCEARAIPTDIIRLLLAAGADPAPGLKVARDYGNATIIQLFEEAAATQYVEGEKIFDVAFVNELPAERLHPLHALPFLLTHLLEHEDALLHAEYRHDGEHTVTWYVRRRSDGKELDDRPIAHLPAGMFSSLVSRIALSADVDYHRGGAGTMTLPQNGRRFECRVFLSRNRESDYWIRVYARAA